MTNKSFYKFLNIDGGYDSTDLTSNFSFLIIESKYECGYCLFISLKLIANTDVCTLMCKF